MSGTSYSAGFAPTSMRNYELGSTNFAALKQAITQFQNEHHAVTSIVNGKKTLGQTQSALHCPHDHNISLGTLHHADDATVDAAIASSIGAAQAWRELSWQDRLGPFLRLVELLEDSAWRERMVAATMLELSKTVGQAYGDAICETIDLVKMNALNFESLQDVQPLSDDFATNFLDYRPLEGFVFAISPFNFTSMSHLAITPALLGNTVVWKPAENASLVASLTMELLAEAGLPDGVINLVVGSGSQIGPRALENPHLAGVSFTGSTQTFNSILETVGKNTRSYRNYPRVIGETGGKGFVFAHPTTNLDILTKACIQGAFEYQGQKCSAATRLYIAQSIWPELRSRLTAEIENLEVGNPASPLAYMGAVINKKQFTKHQQVIADAFACGRVVAGGRTDGTKGWFVWPTLIETSDPLSEFMTEEFFGPILTAYVYPDDEWEEILQLIDSSTVFGLAGSIFANDESVIEKALSDLRYTAGNVTINGKPTGASVGYQPFGGARASGTNDKVGTTAHLLRFLSPRTIKRIF